MTGSFISGKNHLELLHPQQFGFGIIINVNGYYSNIKSITMSKLLIGLATGVIVGLLFAPHTGAETRQKLADAAGDLKDKFNDFVDSLSSEADDLADEAGDMARNVKKEFQ